ncbi:MAG: cytochrome c biogenesis protein CcdA [Nitrospirota bacterium]
MEVLDLTIPTAFFSIFMGIASFLSPCILPLIPSYLSYITGISYDHLKDSQSRKQNRNIVILHSLCFIGGFSFIFVLLGATASTAGSLLFQYLDAIRIVGGVLIILMGILVMNILPLSFLQKEMRLHLQKKPTGYLGTIIIGIIFGAGWTPCTGPFLGSVLALAMETETVETGMALLSFYSLGLGIPFLISGIMMNLFLTSFKTFSKYAKAIRLTSGSIMIFMGILLIMNKLTVLIPF